MERWSGKVAIVTGASSGIGAAIAKALAERGLKVAGFARRKERVEDLAKELKGVKGQLHAVKVDVTDEKSILEGFAWVKANLGPVSVLVNNAGVIQQTSLMDGETEKWKKIFDTNILGLCIATREAVKAMDANNIDGHVIHINSVAGHYVPDVPGLNVYPASKHAVTALTETLRREINFAKKKLKVTSISPGYVATEIAQAAGFVLPENITANPDVTALKSEDIADAVVYALSTPPRVQVDEITIRPLGEPF